MRRAAARQPALDATGTGWWSAWYQGPQGAPVRPPAVSRFAACLTALVLLLSAGHAYGNAQQDDVPPSIDLTLRDSILLALRNNRTLVDARLKRVVEKFSLRVAENKFRPHLTIVPYFDWESIEPSFVTTTGGIASAVRWQIPTGGEFALGVRVAEEHRNTSTPSYYPNALVFAFTQPLLRRAGVGVNTAPVRIARLVEEINVLALQATLIDVISSVARHYRSYIQAERSVDINTQSLQRAQELLAINELLVQAGRMAERDIVQTQADIARRELHLIAAQNRLDAARLALIDLLDIDSRTRLRLSDSLTATPVPIDLAHRIETALQRRPDYLGAMLGIQAAELRVLVAKNARLWDLSLTLSTRFARTDETFRGVASLDKTDYAAQVDLSIPLGRAAEDPRELEYLTALTALKRRQANLEDLRQRIDIEVRNATREAELSLRQVDLALTARQLMEQKTAIEREKLSLGLSTNFQLVTFEDDLVAAQNSEVEAAVAYLNALTALDRTSGTTLDTWGVEIERVEQAGAGSD